MSRQSKTVYRWGLWLILVLSAGVFPAVADAETYEFAFYQPNAAFKDNKEAITAIRSLEKYLSDTLKVEVKGNFFQKVTDVSNFIETSKPAFAFLDMRFFIENRKKYNLVPVVAPLRGNSPGIPAIVLVRKDTPFSSLLDLKGKMFATTGRGEINNNYLSNLVFEKQIDADKYFSLKFVDSSNSAIMAVLYKEADVAVIDKVILTPSFPQYDSLKVIITTQDIIFPPFCILESNVKPGLVEKLKDAFAKLNNSQEAKDFNKPLSIDRWEAVSPQTYDSIEKLLTTPMTNLQKDPVLAETTGSTQKMEASPPRIQSQPQPLFAESEDLTGVLALEK